jgi:hypothetical protein
MGTTYIHPRQTTRSYGTVKSQLGNCVTTTRIQRFLCLLVFVPVSATVGWLPILPRALDHISLALSVSRADEWCRKFWWDPWYSWIFIGGPPGRYIVGSFLGFRLLKKERGPEDNFPGNVIELPHLRLVLMLLFSVIFVALSMVCRGSPQGYGQLMTHMHIRLF